MHRVLAIAALALVLGGTASHTYAADKVPPAAEVLQRVRDTVAEQLDVDPKLVEPGKLLTQLGMDELDLVELIMALEEEFDIQIPDEAVESNGTKGWADAVTAQRLAEIVAEQLRKKR
jgi:acyl carrier protein